MRKSKKLPVLLALLVALSFVLRGEPSFFLPSTVHAGEDQPYKVYLPLVSAGQVEAEQLVSMPFSEAEQQAAEKIWTRAAMIRAKALPVPMVEDVASVVEATNAQIATSGPAETVEGGLPDADAENIARQLYPTEWELAASAIKQDVASHGTELADYCANCDPALGQVYPSRVIGRLFFTIPGEGQAHCSASVAYGRAVWTAGHCVYSPGKGWHTDMVFVPAYRDGTAPYGTFPVVNAVALNGWINGGSARSAYDIAMIAVRDNAGRSVAQWVGWLGAQWNLNPYQQFQIFGYPNNLGQGEYLIGCSADTALINQQYQPPTIGVRCQMTQGSSGGPWIIQYAVNQGGAYNHINGVVSHGTPGSGVVFSPYFGNDARDLYMWGQQQ